MTVMKCQKLYQEACLSYRNTHKDMFKECLLVVSPGGVSILPEVRGHQRSETSQKYGNNFTKHVFSDLEMKLMEVARFISQKFGQ